MSWSAKQYVKFENERTRPVQDLLNAVPDNEGKVVVDIGCGPGNSTELLAARFADAKVIGLDSSADMIEAARKRLPKIHFDVADVSTWDAVGPFDVILANAVLQWVPDHEKLFPRLVSKLAPGGSLAIQMPDNLEEPAHQAMRQAAGEQPWAAILGKTDRRRDRLQTAQGYFDLLRPHCRKVDVWRTIYFHHLAGIDAVVEWFKGTGLRPFLDPLDKDQQASYLARYRDLLDKAYKTLSDGTVLLPFPRLFIVATR